MSITMKALKDFRGKPGEGNVKGNDRLVEAGPEFKVESKKRADALEAAGMAVTVATARTEESNKNAQEQNIENKAADTGPLASAGGETGAEVAPSSSPPALQPQRRRSRKPAGAPDSLL